MKPTYCQFPEEFRADAIDVPFTPEREPLRRRNIRAFFDRIRSAATASHQRARTNDDRSANRPLRELCSRQQ
ncbi:unnamed protein product [Strongylus vulgaris]|uniref:Uncharacterized protein n=1 Tax=Strongylus vulgaris TaxID=40348 RepID=A0A3P7JCG8_STRVU|nr:unnamed protein product [Strongylus vulgaris]